MAVNHSSPTKPVNGQDAIRRQIFREVCAEHGISPGAREALYGYFSQMSPHQLRSRLAAGGDMPRAPTLKEYNDLRAHLHGKGVRMANAGVAIALVLGTVAVVLLLSGATGEVIRRKVKKCTDVAQRQAKELLHLQDLKKDGSNEKCFQRSIGVSP